MITGGLIFLIGLLIGWVLRSLPPRRKALPERTTTCGCKHHLSMHDPKTGQCHGQESRFSDSQGRHWAQCTCRQYVGPQPIGSFVAEDLPVDNVYRLTDGDTK